MITNFLFNQFGVCINPHNYIVLKNPKYALNFCEVDTCYKEGKWAAAFEVNLNNCGISSPIILSDLKYNSESEAILALKKELFSYLDTNDSKHNKEIKTNYLKLVNRLTENYDEIGTNANGIEIQLTLF